jgi:hypothetical protein
MDERQRKSRRKVRAGASLVIGAALLGPLGGQAARAQAPTSSPTWAEAVRHTQATGATSVLVVTSANAPGSKELYRSLTADPTLARLHGQVVVAELSADAEPGQVERLRVSAPAVIAFRRGPTNALERSATFAGKCTPEAVTAWLYERKLVPPAPVETAGVHDAAVTRTGWGHHHDDVQPSPQAPYTPYYAPPPPVREVYEERPVERRIVRRVVREVAPPTRRVVREVEEVEEAPAPRNVLVRTREVAPPTRKVVVREVPAPREVEEVEEVEEAPVTRTVSAPRAMVVREAPQQVLVREAEAPAQLSLIQAGPIDRMLGGIGARLSRRAMPRVNAQIETQKTVRLAPAQQTRVVVPNTPREVQYVPQPPPYAPSPQSYGPVPSPQLPQ